MGWRGTISRPPRAVGGRHDNIRRRAWGARACMWTGYTYPPAAGHASLERAPFGRLVRELQRGKGWRPFRPRREAGGRTYGGRRVASVSWRAGWRRLRLRSRGPRRSRGRRARAPRGSRTSACEARGHVSSASTRGRPCAARMTQIRLRGQSARASADPRAGTTRRSLPSTSLDAFTRAVSPPFTSTLPLLSGLLPLDGLLRPQASSLPGRA